MKHLIISIMAALMPLMAIAGEDGHKWGKPSQQELDMTVCDSFPGAAAVVLDRSEEVNYDMVGGQLKVNYDIRCCIKVLKPEGVDLVQARQLYTHNHNRRDHHESIQYIKAIVYTLDDGKLLKTKVGKGMIRHTDVDDRDRLMTIDFDNITVGSVVEYEYRIVSDFNSTIKPWHAQDIFPVLHTTYRINIPDLYTTHYRLVPGKYVTVANPDGKKTSVSLALNGMVGSVTKAREYFFEGKNLPAMTPQEVNADDYLGERVFFTLKPVNK